MSRRRTLALATLAMCAATPIADAGAARYGSRPLARPMHGKDVKVLQQLLTQWGLPLAVDGAFGRHTRYACAPGSATARAQSTGG